MKHRQETKAEIGECPAWVRYTSAFCAGVWVMGMLILLSGCVPVNTDPFAQVQPPAFTPSSSDMGAYDEHIVALCEAQAMSVTFDLVTMAPEEFTVEEVVAVVDYLYSNCIRDNGRGA